jgi:hypothetical protein
MRNLYLLSALSFFVVLSCACVCVPRFYQQRFVVEEYTSSAQVFLGDLYAFNHDSSECEMEVCEVLKGTVEPGQIICVASDKYCEPEIGKFGEYLIFGSEQKGVFQPNACGFSTLLDAPIVYPPPPMEDVEGLYDTWRAEQRKVFNSLLTMLRKHASKNKECKSLPEKQY